MLVAIGAAAGAAVPRAVVMVPGAVWYEVMAENVGVPDRCLWLGWRLLSPGEAQVSDGAGALLPLARGRNGHGAVRCPDKATAAG
ncbi:MAG: hypothetical protein ACJ76T_12435 [Solirubrobacteraceae bacterium]|jgi:hypothetical protein